MTRTIHTRRHTHLHAHIRELRKVHGKRNLKSQRHPCRRGLERSGTTLEPKPRGRHPSPTRTALSSDCCPEREVAGVDGSGRQPRELLARRRGEATEAPGEDLRQRPPARRVGRGRLLLGGTGVLHLPLRAPPAPPRRPATPAPRTCQRALLSITRGRGGQEQSRVTQVVHPPLSERKASGDGALPPC